MTTFSASLMCGDLLNLKKEIEILEQHGMDYLHIDIMDGHFVPNITFGFDTVNAIGNMLPRDFHLMVEYPGDAIDSLKFYEDDVVTFHIESKGDVSKLIKKLQDKHVKVGLAINPETSIKSIQQYLDDIDHILVMTVVPGFAGQPFVSGSHDKIEELAGLLDKRNLSITIGVDGAIGFDQIMSLSALNVSHFVLGTSALFNGDLSMKAKEVNNLKSRLGAAA